MRKLFAVGAVTLWALAGTTLAQDAAASRAFGFRPSSPYGHPERSDVLRVESLNDRERKTPI